MNKTQLIDAISASSGESKKTVAAIVNAMTEVVQTAVAAGDEVQVIGFGTWTRRFRDASTAPNPRGGAPVTVAAKHVPAFKPGSTFRATVSAA